MVLSVLLALSFGVIDPPTPQTYDPDFIEAVQIAGNRRIQTDTIKFILQTKANDRFNVQVVRADIRRLNGLGYFDDIRVDEEQGKSGRIIIFRVKEKRTIRSVRYEGLKSISNSDVLDRLKEKRAAITQESTYDAGKIKKAESVIKMMLAEKGHQDAKVEAVTEEVPPDTIAVTFKVDEGPTIRIQKVTIQGNKVFTDGEIKNAMKLIKGAGPLTTLTRRNSYFDLKLADDLARIRMLYAQHGYVRVNILDPTVETKPKQLLRTLPLIRPPFPWGIPLPFWKKTLDRYYITIKIEEGDQYRVGEVKVTGNKQFDESTVQKTLGLVRGEIFDEVAVRRNFENLKKMYGARGYINFTAVPIQGFDEARKVINLGINIDEDRQFYVNRIAFSGNTITRDKVIRREIMIKESELFNSSLWDTSLQRLNQLDYFEQVKQEDVEIKPSPTEPTVDVTLKIKEKQKNAIGINGGISSIGGSFLGLSYVNNNFGGLGETFALTLQGGTRQSQYQLSFTQPYLFDRPLTAGFSIFDTRLKFDQTQTLLGLNLTNVPQSLGQNNQLNFEEKSLGFNLFGSYPVRIWNRLGLSFGMNHSQTSAINPATEEFFSAVKTQDNQSFTGSSPGGSFADFYAHTLIPSFIRNRLKGPAINPAGGYSLSTTFEVTGGALGGTVNYFRPTLDYRFYHPMNKGRNTLAVRFLGSHVQGFRGTGVPYYQRFFMGGDFDIRGFDFRQITPIAPIVRNIATTDPTTGNTVNQLFDDVVYVGGDTQGVMNFEYRIPIVGQVFTMAPFFDIGNSWVINKDQLARHVVNSDGQLTTEQVQFLAGTNSGVRSSTGLEFQIMMPVIRAPFRLIFAVNPNRVNNTYFGQATGVPFTISEKAHDIKFTIGRTF